MCQYSTFNSYLRLNFPIFPPTFDVFSLCSHVCGFVHQQWQPAMAKEIETERGTINDVAIGFSCPSTLHLGIPSSQRRHRLSCGSLLVRVCSEVFSLFLFATLMPFFFGSFLFAPCCSVYYTSVSDFSSIFLHHRSKADGGWLQFTTHFFPLSFHFRFVCKRRHSSAGNGPLALRPL